MTPQRPCDVVVVGAGLAGLTATEHLQRAGLDVVLLEAGQRVGGRVRTVRAPFVGGQHVESGAEWVDTVHERMLRLLSRFGGELEQPGQQWTMIRRWVHLDGQMIGPDELDARHPRFRAELDRYDAITEAEIEGLADPAHPERHPHAAEIDARSLADAIREADLGPVASLFAHRNSQGEFAAEPAEVSQLFVLQQRAVYLRSGGAHGQVAAHRVTGGLDRITRGLAGSVGASLRLGEPVVRVELGPESAVAYTPAGAYAAPHLVLACSLIPLRSVRFDPPLPAPLAAAIAGLGYGTVTKTSLQYPARRWPDGYATTDGAIQRVYEPTVGQAGEPGVLTAYTGGDGGRRLAEFEATERLAIVAAGQQAMYATYLGAPLAGISRAWSAEARFGGSYACYRPGQVTAMWELLRRRWGPLHVAGEHAATWTGYMEGAVESGESVAVEIVG